MELRAAATATAAQTSGRIERDHLVIIDAPLQMCEGYGLRREGS
jgi:hypothetical protein